MKTKRLLSKTLALTLGITMAYGALSLPEKYTANRFISASAEDELTAEANGCTFIYDFTQKTGTRTIQIKGIKSNNEDVVIPTTIKHKGIEYPVTRLDNKCFQGNKTIKTLTVPDTVKQFGVDVMAESNVEKIILPDTLELIEIGFARDCPNLESVECKNIDISIYDMPKVLMNCPKLYDENGAITLGNWLISYKPEGEAPSELKIADLGKNGIKIDSIAHDAIDDINGVTKLDLEGVKYLGNRNFNYFRDLKEVVNYDDIVAIWGQAFAVTPWLNENEAKGPVKLGTALLAYKTDSDTVDFTTGFLEDVTCVAKFALKTSPNITTLKCRSDLRIQSDVFYTSRLSESMADPLPKTASYKLKTIYLDGKKLEFNKDEPVMNEWIETNYNALVRTQWLLDNVEAKTKVIFDQMSLTYYGPHNDEIGTLTPTEEFYAVLKIHEFISKYENDKEYLFPPDLIALLRARDVNCSGFAGVQDYLFECAGVEAQMMSTDKTSVHAWNQARIGDDWFICDGGWDAQLNHTYGWTFLSSTCPKVKNNEAHKKENGKAKNWHERLEVKEFHEGDWLLGDLNHNQNRDDDQEDVNILWDYVEGKTDTIDEKEADINFDGKVDVTDAVLLDNFVNGKSIDPKHFVKDGLAPGFNVVYVNGTERASVIKDFTDEDGYLVLSECPYEAPEGMKFKKYNIGKPGQKVKIENPYTVISPIWVDINAPEDSEEPEDSSSSSKPNDSSKPDDKPKGILGDVNGDGAIDIEDAVAIIQHINGMTPLTADQESRADVSKDKNIDIDDAVTLISYINGNSTF